MRGRTSFFIAAILYLPLLFALFRLFSFNDFKPRAEPFLLRFELIDEGATAALFTPPASAPPAPAAPTDSENAARNGERNGAESGGNDRPLSREELNAIFAANAPDDANQPRNPDQNGAGGGSGAGQAGGNAKAVSSVIPTISAAELSELYGLMIHELTPEERRFLDQNLNPIQTITQRYLSMRGYPRLAAMKSMSGEAVLSFTLMPNGDISAIETLRSTGWSLLDDHAIDTILVAYKDYPRPNEPTRIRMRVIYLLR